MQMTILSYGAVRYAGVCGTLCCETNENVYTEYTYTARCNTKTCLWLGYFFQVHFGSFHSPSSENE